MIIMGSMLIYIAVVLFIAYLGWGVMLYIMQPRFLYSPVREVAYTPGELELDFEDVTFKSSKRAERVCRDCRQS